MSSPFAFVTLISSDSYLPGALVLAASLKDLHPSPPQHPEVDFKTVCLVTPETVDVKSIKALRKAFDIVVGVEIIEAPRTQALDLLGRPDLNTVLTKLHAFRLTEYSKIVFLDADILPLQPLSHLFSIPHEFSACPDVGWPDIFNSGCMVFEPGEDKFHELMELMKTQGSWDGADQGLLNEWRGDNWNRLSFTYNTTPTAAYTYAPAYKRFGSSIKAIHFIGPNKPWASIPWRAPIEHPSAESMNSYGYGNLVDRWFSVYDRHYRPPVIATEEEYRVQHYAPSWETATFDTSTPSFGLEDLKKMALEGVLQTVIPAPNQGGEGEYKNMPLEGRIDLMRPSRPAQWDQSTHHTGADDQGYQPAHESSTHQHEHTDHGYRPPGREGLPSYLYNDSQPRHSQEPHSTPHIAHHDHQASQPHENGNAHHQPEHSQENQSWYSHHGDQGNQGDQGHERPQSPEYRPSSPPLLLWNPAVEPPPHNPPPIVGMAFNEQQFTNAWDLPASRPFQQQQKPYEDPWTAQPGFNGHSASPTHHRHDSHQYSNQIYHHQHQHQQQQYQHHPHHQQQQQQQPEWMRPHQKQQQQQHHHHHHEGSSSFPVGGRYSPAHSHGQQERVYPGHSNVDHNRYQPYPDNYHGQEVRSHAAPRPHRQARPEDFFKAPSTHKIPSQLVKEGHYAAVTTTESNVGNVEAIFPWEQRSRPAPRRVFPDWDPKPPRLQTPPLASVAEIEKALIAAAEGRAAPPSHADVRSPSPPPPPHVKRKFNPPPSPPRRQGAIYVNAWDTDHGIQRYASHLQGRPSTSFAPQPWPAHPGQEAHAKKARRSSNAEKEEEEEYTNWTEKAEASSRDGDDEDDEEEGSPILSPRSSARRRAAKAKGNSYRHQGVQTDPIITESRGVQVSSSTFTSPQRRTEDIGSPAHRHSYAGNGYVVVVEPKEVIKEPGYGASHQKPLLPAFEEEEEFLPSAALRFAEERTKAAGEIGFPMEPILRKRESSEDSVTTAAESSIISSPTKEVEEAGTPRVQIRVPDPVESPPLSGRMRQGSGARPRMGGRVFSPTTGVDIFKRGSEEVLARFLMQDPSGWNGTRDTSQGPPTPSAIQ